MSIDQRRELRQGRARLVRGALAALLIVTSVRWMLWYAGQIALVILRGEPTSNALAPALWVVGVLVLAMVAGFLGSARPAHPSETRSFRVGLVVCTLGYAGYYVATIKPWQSTFHGLAVLDPDSMFKETAPQRPMVRYMANSLGFRGKKFEVEKPKGTFRIATIGDSYVFGSGVEATDTLAEQLTNELKARHPKGPFEVLNLGIAGDNLGSHVKVVQVARDVLKSDVIILCLTLPNDLSSWDIQGERTEISHVSPYSLSAFLFGLPTTTFLWGNALLESSITQQGLAFFDEQATRLDAIRAGGEPPLLVFGYSFSTHKGDVAPPFEVIKKRFEGRAGVTVMPAAPGNPEYYIPRDGHPTAAGNKVFSAMMVDALDQIPTFKAVAEGSGG